MIQISALRSRLEKQPTDLRPYASYMRDDALAGGDETNPIDPRHRMGWGKAMIPGG